MWLKCNRTPPFRVDNRQFGSNRRLGTCGSIGNDTSACEELKLDLGQVDGPSAGLAFRITHGNHPRFLRFPRTFQCLAVPQQPLKLLETLEIRVLKSLMLVLGAVT